MLVAWLLLLSLSAIIVLVAWLAWRRVQMHRLRQTLGYKGPPGSLWFGNLAEVHKITLENNNKSYVVFDIWRKKYGEVYAFFRGPSLVVVTHDLDMMKEIFIKKFNSFTDRMLFSLDGSAPGYLSVLQRRGEEWKDMRSLLTPLFSSGKLRMMSTIIQEKTDKFIENVAKFDGYSVDLYRKCQQLTTDVIGQAAFAVDTKCQDDENDTFLKQTKRVIQLLNPVASPLFMFGHMFPEIKLLRYLRQFAAVNAVETGLIQGLRKVLEQRKKVFQSLQRVDVLQLLLLQREGESSGEKGGHELKDGVLIRRKAKRQLTDEEIVANAYVFLIAGYETTSTALGFSVWLLAKHTHVQQRLQEEIDAKLSKQGGVVNYDLVNNMPYLDAVFHECLRVYPPVTVSRFMGERNHHPMAWVPFGSGPRNCIGLRFAELEYKMAIVKLLRRFNLSLGDDAQDPLRTEAKGAAHQPQGEVRVVVKSRQGV